MINLLSCGNWIKTRTINNSVMNQLISIAMGGAIGAVLRYVMANNIYTLFGRAFPWGTLFVNVFGSLLMGFLYVMFVERMLVSSEIRSLVLIGLLGAFTTYSTFSIETLNLIESGELMRAGANIIASVTACLIACWLGLLVGRQI